MTVSFKKPIILTRLNEDNEEFTKDFLTLYPKINSKVSFIYFPLIEIVFEKNLKEKINSNYLIFTSRHGIRAIPNSSSFIDKSIFCVGKTTALVAIEMGFLNVFYPKIGNVSNLIKLICSKVKKKNSVFHYFRGREVSHDLKQELEKFNYEVSETIVYRQKKAKNHQRIRDFVVEENIGGGVFFSANVVRIFCDEVKKVPQNFLFFCISDRVAKEVSNSQLLGDYKIRIASEPTTKEVMNLIYNEKFLDLH